MAIKIKFDDMTKHPDTLFVFDIDDTLIDTQACIRAVDKDGNVVFKAGTKVFNAPDSTERLLRPGLTWDFTEFESLEQIISEPVLPAFDDLLRLYDEVTIGQIIVVTARQKQRMIQQWLIQNDVYLPLTNIYCYDHKSRLSVADWKAKVVAEEIRLQGTKKVILYEDDPENIKSIKEVCERLNMDMGCPGIS